MFIWNEIYLIMRGKPEVSFEEMAEKLLVFLANKSILR
jgi:hypothetical protein